MKLKLFFTVIVAVLMTVSGSVIAGPGGKGKAKVVIEHSNGSENGDGYVVIEVPVPAAIAHLARHEGDCVLADPDTQVPDLVPCSDVDLPPPPPPQPE